MVRKHSFFQKSSINTLMHYIPLDGCLLVFNAHHLSWNAEASEQNVYCHVLEHRKKGEGKPVYRDLYVAFKE